MGKRDRENPCEICGHFHKYEEGEICETCGHRLDIAAAFAAVHVSAFPSEILAGFIYLGMYDNATHPELLRTQGITHLLNVVPASKAFYKSTFTYHCIEEDQMFPFEDALQFLEQCERDKARVLVYCMSGKSRSPAIVIAYLMKSKGWKLAQSYRWVKDRRSSVELNPVHYKQLQEYEQKLVGSEDKRSGVLSSTQSLNLPAFIAGPSTTTNPVGLAFNNPGEVSIFNEARFKSTSQNFTFTAGEAQQSPAVDSTMSTNSNMAAFNDASMDSS